MISRRHLLAAVPALVAAPALAQETPPAPKLPEVHYDPLAPVLGNPQGDVTIVEYFDYQCGVCKRMHPLLLDVVARDGQIRLVMRDWIIFGEGSHYAAQVALGAQALGRYLDVHLALMATGSQLTKGDVFAALSATSLTPAAALAAYRQKAEAYEALLLRNDAQAMGFGFNGTPSFVVGNAVYPGAFQSREDILQAVAEARARQTPNAV
ncbi:DsbA family protein [Asticcacaulis sp. DW145]|uniref:DsbA family protein n=1 Tax=Asticcacaulis sp. DW145 TaxID=3095608 RepID=UPI0030928325|nr:DsbA family protein [Asticcacaulis sp. DW145]